MVKTYKNLYPQIYDFENLYRAYRKARRGKRRREQVYRFEFDLESNLLRLQEELAGESYMPGEYRHFYVTAPKRRDGRSTAIGGVGGGQSASLAQAPKNLRQAHASASG